MKRDDLRECAAAASVESPRWEGVRRVHVLASNEEEALAALRETFGEDAFVGALVFRGALAEALERSGGRDGHWVAAEGGEELFIPLADPEAAKDSYRASSGREPDSMVGSGEVRERLAEVDQAFDALGSGMIISQPLLKMALGEG